MAATEVSQTQLHSTVVASLAKHTMDPDLAYILPASFVGGKLNPEKPDLLVEAGEMLIRGGVHRNATAKFFCDVVGLHAWTDEFVENVKTVIPDFAFTLAPVAEPAASSEEQKTETAPKKTRKKPEKAVGSAGAQPPPAKPAETANVSIPITAEEYEVLPGIIGTSPEGFVIGQTLWTGSTQVGNTPMTAWLEVVNTDSGIVLAGWISEGDALKATGEPLRELDKPLVITIGLVDYQLVLLPHPL